MGGACSKGGQGGVLVDDMGDSVLANSRAEQGIPAFKVVSIGDAFVGKSSLVVRFSRNVFDDSIKNTLGAAFISKTVKVLDREVKLQVWDTAGAETFRACTKSYLRDSHAAFLVYDVGLRSSFESLKAWLSDLMDVNKTTPVVFLVANKIDRDPSERVITPQEGKDFAALHKLHYYECSAKTGHNVTELFSSLARETAKANGY